jgi:hypothetical protein
LFAPWPQFEGYAFSRTVTKASTDIGTADDEILAVISPTADQDMNMRVVGVPVIDRHPIELGVEIPFDILHQLAGEAAQIFQLGGILGRDNKPEVMTVIRGPLGEGALIGLVGIGIEHFCFRSVPRHAVALEVGDMLGQRCRPKFCAVMANHARLHHHAPRSRMQRQ